jgi:Ca2+-binding EF-hand superfamily protein
MTIKSLLITTAFFALAGPAFAQQTPMPGQPMPPPQQGGRPGPFERLDTNNDGVITREEIRILRTATFTRLDTNRDGFLAQDEMAAGMAAMRRGSGEEAGRPQAGTEGGPDSGPRGGHRGGPNLASADTNRDGAVSRAEFDAAISANQARRNAEAGANRDRLFAALDANRDGSLSSAEMAAAPARHKGNRGGGMGPMRDGGGRPNLDTNNDQKVSLAEWLARPEPLFDRGDANNDGRVTREEAAALVRQGRGGDGRPSRPW